MKEESRKLDRVCVMGLVPGAGLYGSEICALTSQGVRVGVTERDNPVAFD